MCTVYIRVSEVFRMEDLVATRLKLLRLPKIASRHLPTICKVEKWVKFH